MSTWGSSPRLRGTPAPKPAGRTYTGIIPALAGNTTRRIFQLIARRDHPRACGEHLAPFGIVLLSIGSSPRLRGTPPAKQQWRVRWGIIPALAGNTPTSLLPCRVRRDHPRACGEHFNPARPALGSAGSSPRLRGTPICAPSLSRSVGIIPALAGNTGRGARACHGGWDHPRACGEHSDSQKRNLRAQGSSPRLRGTLRGQQVQVTGGGIIPALAGNTTRCASRDTRPWDHPRACGEHTAGDGVDVDDVGSSPRLRGTLRRSAAPSRPPGDHPRACGEHYS
ncbi:hypothetical protein PG1770B_1301 [Bifidobacterium pseudolongum subsp. globosum]|nr:hypothetical protein PG1770B_1301 [Bifidobacterium pseudolongum subsp. globosum]